MLKLRLSVAGQRLLILRGQDHKKSEITLATNVSAMLSTYLCTSISHTVSRRLEERELDTHDTHGTAMNGRWGGDRRTGHTDAHAWAPTTPHTKFSSHVHPLSARHGFPAPWKGAIAPELRMLRRNLPRQTIVRGDAGTRPHPISNYVP